MKEDFIYSIISGLFSFSTVIFIIYSFIANDIKKKLLFSKTTDLLRYNIIVLFLPFLELTLILIFFILFNDKLSSDLRMYLFLGLFAIFIITTLFQSYFVLIPLTKPDSILEKLKLKDVKTIKSQLELQSLDRRANLIYKSIEKLFLSQNNDIKNNDNYWIISENYLHQYFQEILDLDYEVKNSIIFVENIYDFFIKYDININLRNFDLDEIILQKVEISKIGNNFNSFKTSFSNLVLLINLKHNNLDEIKFNQLIQDIIEVIIMNIDFIIVLIEFSCSNQRNKSDAHLIFNFNKNIKEIIKLPSLNERIKESFVFYLKEFVYGGRVYIENQTFSKLIKDMED